MIKLDPIKTTASSGVTRSKKSSKTAPAFHLTEPTLTTNSVTSGAPSTIDMIACLTDLQEITSQPLSHHQLKNRGEYLLEQLNRLRIGLLEGAFSSAHLKQLAHYLQSHRDCFDHSPLAQTVLEIEQRVAVELAKLEIIENRKNLLSEKAESSTFMS
jgi:hypothetical protein